jgi:hypothetical protein
MLFCCGQQHTGILRCNVEMYLVCTLYLTGHPRFVLLCNLRPSLISPTGGSVYSEVHLVGSTTPWIKLRS